MIWKIFWDCDVGKFALFVDHVAETLPKMAPVRLSLPLLVWLRRCPSAVSLCCCLLQCWFRCNVVGHASSKSLVKINNYWTRCVLVINHGRQCPTNEPCTSWSADCRQSGAQIKLTSNTLRPGHITQDPYYYYKALMPLMQADGSHFMD